MRATVSFIAISLLVYACAGPAEEPTPTLYASGDEDAPPSDALTEDERELREMLDPLYERCDHRRDDLEAERRGWRRRLAAETVVAGAAAQTADLAEGQDTDLPQPGTQGANFVEPMPSWSAGSGSPSRQSARDSHSEAVIRVRRMNEAIEALDEFLFAHPRPGQWSDEERSDFDQRRSDLRRACD